MCVSKMTSQRTISWDVARRELTKGDFGVPGMYVRDTHFFSRCTKGAYKSCEYVRYIEVYIFSISWY